MKHSSCSVGITLQPTLHFCKLSKILLCVRLFNKNYNIEKNHNIFYLVQNVLNWNVFDLVNK